ncbi:chromosomal replication initiator protein DnaA [Candidatus Cytomitobacter indipagum]|uniref:Chromosomal replication initiator protein DnaA n=1 Tax=Candidatus Cytomitobacter indipagum TaxID=2601575 RepID=A0A5C0UDU8_9PROT|nr:chromosomal replication initiator protein DnaA [Candidatus Cytomitobacter indipagum]QEK37813.1 chromosomal replication initiator protein DnaA [Candidatus Cytomitobacter indipagum]
MSSVWQDILTELKSKLGDSTVSSWFDGVEVNIVKDKLYACVKTKFIANWIKNHYLDIVQDIAKKHNLSIEFEVKETLAKESSSKINNQKNEISYNNKNEYSLPLSKDMVFETFIVGRSNEMAYTSALRIAQSEERIFNPLFLYGPVGLGKTHLMHSIGWYIKKNFHNNNVCYLSAEQFMLKFINALKQKDMMSFKEELRSFDILMIDDFQFLSGKDSTQEEFFHTFVYLISQGKQLVISADKPPSELSGIEERLRSRLGSGLVVNLHPANYELRLSILKEKSIGRNINDEILQFIAENVKSSIRELGGALMRVIAYVDFFKKDLDLDTVKGILKEFVQHKKPITPELIIDSICKYYNIEKDELCSKSRKRNILKPRQIAMYLCRELTDSSLPEIGRFLGGKDHTTAMHSIKKIEQSIDSLESELQDIKQMIK